MKPVRIIQYSHFISVHTPEFPFINQIRRWALGNCTKWDKRWDHRTRKLKSSIGARFHINRLKDTEWRFHINQSDSFYRFLDEQEIPYVISEAPLYQPLTANYHWSSDKSPRAHQPPVIDFIKKPAKVRQVSLQTGKGKSVSVDERLLTPNGWVRMGDVKVGDTLTAYDGTESKITGVYPQGALELFTVTFEDGRTLEACAEHLWRTYRIQWPTRSKITNTKDIQQYLEDVAESRICIDLMTPTPKADVPLGVDPYLLGSLLGDSVIGETVIKRSSAVTDKLKSLLPSSSVNQYRGASEWSIRRTNESDSTKLFRQFYDWGLADSVRFIPDEYFDASPEQRRDVIRGLLDNDGEVLEDGWVGLTLSSARLADDIVSLARSIGAKAAKEDLSSSKWYRGILGSTTTQYRVRIRAKEAKEIVSQSGLLAELCQYDNPNLRLLITDVKSSRVAEAQCIKIDHPDRLFVAGDHVVTHNTFCALYSIAELKTKTMLITKPGYFDRWRDDILESLGLKWDEVLYIRGNAELVDAIQDAKAGKLDDIKFIVTGFNTLQVFIRDCIESNAHVGKYGIEWHELFETFGIGIRLIDEVHEWFHFNYLLDLMTNCPKVLSLSATMRPKDPFMQKMYLTAYPQDDRYEAPYDKYINVRSLIYQLADPYMLKNKKIKYRTGMGYNHIMYEDSIRANHKLRLNYFNMIRQQILPFVKDEDGKKVISFDSGKGILFVAKNDTADDLAKFLRATIPGLPVYTYTRSSMTKKQKDEWEWKPGLIISTLKSAGTAVDIPDLVVTFLTHNVDSDQANEQVLGRTRKPTDKDFTPQFIYFSCSDIETHMKYDKNKERVFKGKVKGHSRTHIGWAI